MTTAKKTTTPRRTPKVTNGDVAPVTEDRTVITSTGSKQMPEFADPEDVKAATQAEKKFADLDVDELRNIAEFFVKDFEPDAGKNELLAALATSTEDEEAVTWDDYQNLFLPSRPSKAALVEQKPAGAPVVSDDNDGSNDVLVYMQRKNPRYDIAGYTFTTQHPFNSVPQETAEFIIKNGGGFRLAMPSEVADYYN